MADPLTATGSTTGTLGTLEGKTTFSGRSITPASSTGTLTATSTTVTTNLVPDKPLDSRNAQVTGPDGQSAGTGAKVEPPGIKIEPPRVVTANITNPADTLAFIAAVQQEEAGITSERWPNEVIEAARQIQTREDSLLSRISSRFDARHGARVSFNKRTITYKGVEFTLQTVNGKQIVVCSSKTVSGAAMRAIAAEFQKELQEKLAKNQVQDANFDDNKLTIDGNPTIVFPGEPGEGEIIKLQGDRSGNLVISPQNLRNQNSAETKFMTQLSYFDGDEFKSLHRQLTGLQKSGSLNLDQDHQAFQLDLENLQKAVELLESSVEPEIKPAEEGDDLNVAQGLFQTAAGIISQDDTDQDDTAGQQKIFAEAKAKLLAPYLGGDDGEEKADRLLRAIRLAKNKDNVSEVFGIYKTLGGKIPENMTESSLALLLRIGRDILAVAKYDAANPNVEALGRLASQLSKRPIAIQKEADQTVITLFEGYANAEQEIDCRTATIPENAFILTLKEGNFEVGTNLINGTSIAASGNTPVPPIDLLMGGGLRISAGKRAADASPDTGDGAQDGDITLEPAPIANWAAGHKANGNCALFAIHDSAQRAGLIKGEEGGQVWQKETNYQKLRKLAKDEALKDFRNLCLKNESNTADQQPNINTDVFLGAAYAVAARRGLIHGGQGHFTQEDMLEIARIYSRNTTNSNEQIGWITPRIRALCNAAFHAITLGTDQSWVDIESMPYLARALGKQIVVADAQDDGRIRGYRIYQPNGGCVFCEATQNGGIGNVNGNTQQRPEIDGNPIVIVKTANHYLGISEVMERAKGKNPIKTPDGQPLAVSEDGDMNSERVRVMFHLQPAAAAAATT